MKKVTHIYTITMNGDAAMVLYASFSVRMQYPDCVLWVSSDSEPHERPAKTEKTRNS